MSMTPCDALIDDQQNLGQFVSHLDAKLKLNSYLADAGIKQPVKTDPDHVYGHMFGLNVLKELFMRIDKYNTDTVIVADQITALRVYRSKSPDKDGVLRPDVLLVPVKRNGDDYPVPLAEAVGGDMIVANSGPCPNICSKTFFFVQMEKVSS